MWQYNGIRNLQQLAKIFLIFEDNLAYQKSITIKTFPYQKNRNPITKKLHALNLIAKFMRKLTNMYEIEHFKIQFNNLLNDKVIQLILFQFKTNRLLYYNMNIINKTYNLCSEHQLQKRLLCIDQNCTKHRLICQQCIDYSHYLHQTRFLKSGTPQFAILSINKECINRNKLAIQLQNKKEIAKYYLYRVMEIMNKMRETQKQLQRQIVEIDAYLQTFSQKSTQKALCFLKNFDVNSSICKSEQYKIKQIINKIRYLQSKKHNKPQQVVDKLKDQLENTVQSLKSYINKQLIMFEKIQKNKFNLTPQEDMRQIQGKSHKRYKQDSYNLIQQNSIKLLQHKKQQEVIKQQIKAINNFRVDKQSNNLIITQKQSIEQPITEKDIISIFKKQPISIKNIKIYGNNQFNLKCLNYALQKFPKLQYLNYIYPFQYNIKKFIISQAFHGNDTKFIHNNSLDLNIDNQYQYLEKTKSLKNLILTNTDYFIYHQFYFQNQVRHVTINNYFAKQKVVKIPPNLFISLQIVEALKSLNLFNIEYITKDLVKVIRQNRHLKQLLIIVSEEKARQKSFATNINEQITSCLGITKLKNIIFYNCRLRGQLTLPPTLQVLCLDGCEISSKISGLGETNSLSYFSIYKCNINNEQNEKLVSDLCKSASSSLEYLNIVGLQMDEHKIMTSLKSFKNIKYLCIGQTKIGLRSLVCNIIPFRKKLLNLDIILNGKAMTQKNLKDLAELFPYIQILFLTYNRQLTPQLFKNYKSLTKIGIYISDNSSYIQQFNTFYQQMKLKYDVLIIDK